MVNIGPSHPSTHGVFRAVVHLDGEIVTKVVPHIGYLHRGLEKMAENRTYMQIMPLTDRLDYVGSMYSNWAYCRALERLAGIRVPERAEYLRVIVCELQRIASHMMGIGSSAADTGATTGFVYAFEQREMIIELFEELCGSRLTYNYVRPGGVSFDVPEGWVEGVRAFIKQNPKAMMELDSLFLGNVIARARLKGIGVLSAQDAIDWGVSGPTARGSGIDWDMRHDDPYSVYPRLDFDVPVGDNGDCYDRARVKVFECIESCKLVEQALDQIEPGPVHAPGLPRLIAPPEGEAYDHIESARGSLGVYLVSDGGTRPARMHVRSPAFCNLAVIDLTRPRLHAFRPRGDHRVARPRVRGGGPMNSLAALVAGMDPANLPWLGLAWGVLLGLVAGVAIALATMAGVWGERKVCGRIHLRYGPQQAGPFGLLQVPADTLKLLLKEDIIPSSAEPFLFKIAPLIVFAPVAMSMVVVPFWAHWAPLDTTVGLLFFLAVPSLSVIGVLVGGWSSHNTFATLGGLRGAAQMVSYEIPRTLSVLAVVLLAGSMRPTAVVGAWRWWWIPLLAIALVNFFIASIAELNRGPFDIAEAESELVAGYFADYSGIRWSIFMMSEYGGMLVAGLFIGSVFLGLPAWLPGPLGLIGVIAVAVIVAVIMIWAKWTFPRLRQDQLMSFAWKVLTPLALLQLVIVGLVLPWL